MMISGLIWILSLRQQRRADENRRENESYPRYFDFDHNGLLLLKLRGKDQEFLSRVKIHPALSRLSATIS